MCSNSVNEIVFYTYIINQLMHINKYVQSHIIIFHQLVSVTLVTIIRVFFLWQPDYGHKSDRNVLVLE
jgi:hypothetical protein